MSTQFRTQIVCFHDEFCFLYGEEYTIALDLKTGAVIQRISIGTIASIEPIFNEEGLCTKYYIVGKFNRGILDLDSPFINRKFEVVLLPAVHSIKAAVDKIQRAEVVYGDLSKTLPELCKAEPHHVESQVLLLKENKFRCKFIVVTFDFLAHFVTTDTLLYSTAKEKRKMRHRGLLRNCCCVRQNCHTAKTVPFIVSLLPMLPILSVNGKEAT